MKLKWGVFQTLLGFIITFWIWNIGSVQAKPYVPESDSAIVEHVPLSGDPRIRQIRDAQLELSQDPRNLELAVHLARQLVELGRAEADPRYDGYAQSALQPWWNSSTPPSDVLFLRALLRQRSHHFDEALEDLTQVLHNRPRDAQAWLTSAVIHQVRGHYEEARKTCLPLLRLTNALVSTTCITNVASLNGQAQESYQSLLNIFSLTPSADPQQKLWTLTILAETAMRLGNTSAAEEHFQEALSLGIRDTYLLGAYSDWLLDQHRPADVQTLLQNDFRPDGLLLRAALSAQQLNNPQLPHHVASLSSRFADSRLRRDTRHLREEARFTLHLLKHPKQALHLAQENWTVQREPWDARILLEAALATGDHKAAQPVIQWINDVRLEDEQIHRLMEQLT
ncbi:MAG: tetratricopeptide repeat protein [Nitrospirales bacterium]|nr:hypothetical protein [Nitrospirales bacterium]